jgi:hypothetical protein
MIFCACACATWDCSQLLPTAVQYAVNWDMLREIPAALMQLLDDPDSRVLPPSLSTYSFLSF